MRTLRADLAVRHPALIRHHDLAFRTQYVELKERVQASGLLLPGTPGSLAFGHSNRSGAGILYRVFYPVPKKVSEDYICGADDETALHPIEGAATA
ncbi:MAG TPA: hypothetical protein PK177_12480 [Burkholderiaceae bacterium]|nr:hypothetical protein [Burkholderiaceae bacterium]